MRPEAVSPARTGDGAISPTLVSSAPSPLPAPARPRPARVVAPDEVWDQVRAAYVGGMSAPACCERFGVGLTALRNRAAEHGWRRADQPWTPRNGLDPWDEGVVLEEQVGGNLDQVEYCQLIFVAERRTMRAVMRGDANAALRWNRVRNMLVAEDERVEREIAQYEAVHHYLHHKGPLPGQDEAAPETDSEAAAEADDVVDVVPEAVEVDDVDGLADPAGAPSPSETNSRAFNVLPDPQPWTEADDVDDVDDMDGADAPPPPAPLAQAPHTQAPSPQPPTAGRSHCGPISARHLSPNSLADRMAAAHTSNLRPPEGSKDYPC